MLRDFALKERDGVAIEGDLIELGQVANLFASQSIFTDFRIRKAKNTLRRHDSDLALFAEFLNSRGVEVGDLATDSSVWKGITWGLVAAFQAWLLGRGYAVSSVNVKISTVKVYAKLAFKAGVLDATDYALIRAVEGYARKKHKHIDNKREAAGIETRIGSKKSDAVSLTWVKAKKLKDQPDTPQGRRDKLIMCLLLDHGLRVSELAGLKVEDFDLELKRFKLYRPKIDEPAKHKLTSETFQAARAYLENDANESGTLFRGSYNKGDPELWRKGELVGVMSKRAISKRVRSLGRKIGIENLSPHDCRHYAATKYAKSKTIRDLMDIFGWNSTAMAGRYIKSASVVTPEDKID
jgi:integrase